MELHNWPVESALLIIKSGKFLKREYYVRRTLQSETLRLDRYLIGLATNLEETWKGQ